MHRAIVSIAADRMTLHGLAWPCMALHGLAWPCMALHDSIEARLNGGLFIAPRIARV
jgi:hypothetical protein